MKINRFIKCVSLGIMSISFCSCSLQQINRNSSNQSFLRIGETAQTGKLSQTIKRLDYVPTNSLFGLDENDAVFDLEFVLHSDYENITALSGVEYHKAVFDDNNNNGGIYMFGGTNFPSSIAPNSDETVVLRLKCFKDWKKATITYKDNNNNSYSFSIRSIDYPDYINNDFTVLKEGECYLIDNERAQIYFHSLQLTTTASEQSNADSDNLELFYSITSRVDETIQLPSSSFAYSLQCDGGFSSCHFTGSATGYQTILPGYSSVKMKMIISLSKTWQKFIFECKSELSYKFVVRHVDVNY